MEQALWLGSPVATLEGNNTGHRHEQSIKCQALRVMILDELSMNSAELLGALNYVTKKAIRATGTYKKRTDGTTRVFGGLNVVMCVDFWQRQPVTGTWLCANPLDIPAGRAHDALEILWGTGPDSIRKFWSLTELMRCKDPWYKNFLHECRNGTLNEDMYCFITGWPTLVPSEQECRQCWGDIIQDPVLGRYQETWADVFLQGADMSTHIDSFECAACKKSRSQRKRVLSLDAGAHAVSDQERLAAEARRPPYTDAPALYSFNVPRYFNILLRAREFARHWRSELFWCHAVDIPLHPGDCDLPEDAIQRKLIS